MTKGLITFTRNSVSFVSEYALASLSLGGPKRSLSIQDFIFNASSFAMAFGGTDDIHGVLYQH